MDPCGSACRGSCCPLAKTPGVVKDLFDSGLDLDVVLGFWFWGGFRGLRDCVKGFKLSDTKAVRGNRVTIV